MANTSCSFTLKQREKGGRHDHVFSYLTLFRVPSGVFVLDPHFKYNHETNVESVSQGLCPLVHILQFPPTFLDSFIWWLGLQRISTLTFGNLCQLEDWSKSARKKVKRPFHVLTTNTSLANTKRTPS